MFSLSASFFSGIMHESKKVYKLSGLATKERISDKKQAETAVVFLAISYKAKKALYFGG